MTPAIQTQQTFRIHVIAASPAASLAILSIASTLGIEPQQAADRLASLPTVLAEDVPGPKARQLSAVLMAVGLRIRLDPTPSEALAGPAIGSEPQRDLSLQPATGSDRLAFMALVGRLARLVGLPPEMVDAGLSGPEGLVLRKVTDLRIDALRAAVRRDGAVRLIVSEPESATFDAFRVVRKSVPGSDLIRLGLSRCRFSGAVAAGLNHTTALYLARRANGRLIITNRDFQRFNLILTAAPGLAPKELAGFLEARPGAWQADGDTGPRQIERDLPYEVAQQFIADYALIGLEVQARLRGLAR